jgi:uncharacterized protein YutE (UPF0331/DUF86 family)
MPRYDQEKMVNLVSELRKSIARLRELGKLPQDEFLKDPDKIGSSKYHFIVAIESTIDMSNHIISRNGYRVLRKTTGTNSQSWEKWELSKKHFPKNW